MRLKLVGTLGSRLRRAREGKMDLTTVVATVAAAVSAVVAAFGLSFAGRQLQIANKQHDIDQRVAYDGVAVSWHAIEAPARAEADGRAQWLYEIAVHNPGKLPIQHVVIRLTLPCEVTRIRYDGSLGRPTRTLTMRHPVLAGGEHRDWRRRLLIQFDARRSLRDTFAHVKFRDVDGKQYSNRWPRYPGDLVATPDDDNGNEESGTSSVAPGVCVPVERVVAAESGAPLPDADFDADDSGRPAGRHGDADAEHYTAADETPAEPLNPDQLRGFNVI